MLLKNKVALISGATRGIGYEIASAYLANGAKIMICGSKETTVTTAIQKLKEQYPNKKENINGTVINLKKNEDIQKIVQKTISTYGNIDILVNNAGITSACPLTKMSEEDFINMFEINFFGMMRLTKAVIPFMKEKGGSIINTSSMVSFYGAPNQTAYASSKSAVNGFTKSLAKELGAYNIRVNAVAPGVVQTDMVKENVTKELEIAMQKMIPLKRMASPAELSGAYVYLASDNASYTTGTIIQVDGGLVM